MYPNLFKSLTAMLALLLSTAVHAQEMTAQKILSNTIEISMPEDFKSSIQDITETYSDEKKQAVVSFTSSEMAIPEEFVPQIGKQMEQQLLSQYKIEKTIGTESLKANGKSIYTIAFITSEKSYVRMFVFTSQGKLVTGQFSCKTDVQAEWEKKADTMIRSLKDVK